MTLDDLGSLLRQMSMQTGASYQMLLAGIVSSLTESGSDLSAAGSVVTIDDTQDAADTWLVTPPPKRAKFAVGLTARFVSVWR